MRSFLSGGREGPSLGHKGPRKRRSPFLEIEKWRRSLPSPLRICPPCSEPSTATTRSFGANCEGRRRRGGCISRQGGEGGWKRSTGDWKNSTRSSISHDRADQDWFHLF